jgi:xylulokinase
VPECAVGAAYGDAFLAGLASGIVPDRAALHATWVRTARVYEPDPELFGMYTERYAIFRRMYERTKDDIHLLAMS